MSEVVHRLRQAGYNVRTRAQWGTQHADVYAERLRSKPVDFPVPYGFAHITVTRGKGDFGMRVVERIGFDRFGSGVSYNWCVEHVSNSEHVIYEGMPLGAKGTHTVNEKNVDGFPENLNYFGHAVAFMAMPDVEPFCEGCVRAYGAIFAAEKVEGVMRDEAVIFPHSKFAAKDCPSQVQPHLGEVNRLSNQHQTQQQEETLSWGTNQPNWSPDDGDAGNPMTAGQQLSQARGYAEDTYQRVKDVQSRLETVLDHAQEDEVVWVAEQRQEVRTVGAKVDRLEQAFLAFAASFSEETQQAVADALDNDIDVEFVIRGDESA